jgi:hypothetical protein
MQLKQEDFETVGAYINGHLTAWLAESSLGKSSYIYEIDLRERIVRVEEELKHQRDLMKQGFEMMDKRFEELWEDMNKRFEQIDKRFEQVEKNLEDINRRIERFMVWSFGIMVSLAVIIIAVMKLT